MKADPAGRQAIIPASADRQVLRERLFRHVDCLAGLIGPRTLKKRGSMEAAAGYIEGVWRGMGWEVAREKFDALGDPAANLVVEKKGTSRGGEIVLLGAHYDTVDATPGADDNASAVAVMLEASRLLKDFIGQRTLRCVAFACEEPPYFNVDSMGSQHHAREARRRGERIVGMLCLEMVGYFRKEPGTQGVPQAIPRVLRWMFPKRGDFLAAVGNLSSWRLAWQFRSGFRRATRQPLFTICLPERIGEIRLSDNSSFWDQGYPALMLTDTSYLRNPNYHLESDMPETLDYDAMTEVTLGVAGAMKAILRSSSRH